MILEAAVTGAIDFTQADLRDPNWYRRLHLILNKVGDQQTRQYWESVQRQRTGHLIKLSLVRPGMSPDHLEQLRQFIDHPLDELRQSLFPWLADAQQSSLASRRTAYAELSAAWEEEYGKLDDPATQAKIAATVAAMRAQKG